MKKLFRWLFRLLILLVVLTVAAILLIDPVAREIVAYRIRKETGLEVKIGMIDVGILNPRVAIENLVVYNSGEFGGSPLIEVPDLLVEYDRGRLWSHELRCKLVRLKISTMNVVEDKQGRVNLAVVQAHMLAEHKSKGGAPSMGGLKFTEIETLNLTLGQAPFTSLRDTTQNKVFKLDVTNQPLNHVKSWNDLAGVGLAVELRNGINPIGYHGAANDPWSYWHERMETNGLLPADNAKTNK